MVCKVHTKYPKILMMFYLEVIMNHFEDKLFRCLKREKKLTVNKYLRSGLNKSGDPLIQKCTSHKCRKYKERNLNDC